MTLTACRLEDATSGNKQQQAAELSARTFCTFPREFSSFRRQRLLTGSDLIPDRVLRVP
jgi:hypothetical protein